MSLRQVLTIYNAERQLNDDETALLNTLRRMTDAEREMVSQSLSDKPQKKASKKSSGAAKSRRASGMAEQLSSRRQEGIAVKTDGRCNHQLSYGVCALLPDHNIHHLKNHPNYHPFVGNAQSADNQSPVNGEAKSIIQNSVDETVSAGAVAGGSSND